MNEDFTLTDEAFQTFVRNHAKFTIRHLIEMPSDSLTPDLVIITRSPEGKDQLIMCTLAVPFNEDNEKRDVLFGIGKRMYEEKQVAMAIVLSSEAWMSHRALDDKSPAVQPRHDPNRKEHIIVVGSGMQGHQRLLIHTPVRRDDNNHIIIDSESVEMPTAKFPLLEWFWRGYFATLLPK